METKQRGKRSWFLGPPSSVGRRALRESRGKLESLNKRSTAPKERRRRNVPESVKNFMLREREDDARLSKDKLAVMLREEGIAHLSASTVGRMLADLKNQGRPPDPVKLSLVWPYRTAH